ncbi:MAG: hypothetical protein ACR2P4_03840 [Gammaproteobacteria bacterium]
MSTKNNNRIVQGLWIGGRLSELERLCIRSFCANGHEFHLYAYEDLQNLPQVEGLRVMDGADILPRSAIFRYRHSNSLAGFADRFRWELMRQKGGWYADMDVVALRPLDFSAQMIFAYEAPDALINSALMKFPRGHYAAAAVADACADINKFVPWDTHKRKTKKIKRRLLLRRHHRYLGWGEAGGPIAITLAVRHFNLEKYALPAHSLYYQYHPLVNGFFDDALHKSGVLDVMLSGTFSLHLMHNIVQKKGIDKDGTFPENSPYEILKRRYPEPGK